MLVAHHDAAHTGLMWHPALAGGAGRNGRPPFSLLPELAMAALAAGPRRLRAPARALLALAGALSLDVTRGATVPGASDNATGVAAVIELVRRLARRAARGDRGDRRDPGCRGIGDGRDGGVDASRGARARPALDARARARHARRRRADGRRPPRGRCGRSGIRAEDLALADRGAAAAGLDSPRRFRIGGCTDPALARLAGLPAISLLSLAGNGFSNYHLPTDVAENVDWTSVERCLALAEADRAGRRADGRR